MIMEFSLLNKRNVFFVSILAAGCVLAWWLFPKHLILASSKVKSLQEEVKSTGNVPLTSNASKIIEPNQSQSKASEKIGITNEDVNVAADGAAEYTVKIATSKKREDEDKKSISPQEMQSIIMQWSLSYGQKTTDAIKDIFEQESRNDDWAKVIERKFYDNIKKFDGVLSFDGECRNGLCIFNVNCSSSGSQENIYGSFGPIVNRDIAKESSYKITILKNKMENFQVRYYFLNLTEPSEYFLQLKRKIESSEQN